MRGRVRVSFWVSRTCVSLSCMPSRIEAGSTRRLLCTPLISTTRLPLSWIETHTFFRRFMPTGLQSVTDVTSELQRKHRLERCCSVCLKLCLMQTLHGSRLYRLPEGLRLLLRSLADGRVHHEDDQIRLDRAGHLQGSPTGLGLG